MTSEPLDWKIGKNRWYMLERIAMLAFHGDDRPGILDTNQLKATFGTLATAQAAQAEVARLRDLVIDARWIIEEQVLGMKKYAAGPPADEWLNEARAALDGKE